MDRPCCFENLPFGLQEKIGQANAYVEKLYFDRFLKLISVWTLLAAHRYHERSERSIPLFWRKCSTFWYHLPTSNRALSRWGNCDNLGQCEDSPCEAHSTVFKRKQATDISLFASV